MIMAQNIISIIVREHICGYVIMGKIQVVCSLRTFYEAHEVMCYGLWKVLKVKQTQ